MPKNKQHSPVKHAQSQHRFLRPSPSPVAAPVLLVIKSGTSEVCVPTSHRIRYLLHIAQEHGKNRHAAPQFRHGVEIQGRGAHRVVAGSEAEKYDRQALDIIQSYYGKNHPETSSALTILGRALVAEGKTDEAGVVLHQALELQELANGKMHPQVALTVNELGKLALQRGNLDEAEADFTRAENIWNTAYNGKHYYIGTALANLGGVYLERKQYDRAEYFFREALAMYTKTLPEDHKLLGITRIRLGGVIVAERRYRDAEVESLGGYQILMKQTNSPPNWMLSARKDLVAEYEPLNQPAKAASMRAQLAVPADESPSSSVTTMK